MTTTDLWRRLSAELTPVTRFQWVPFRPPVQPFIVTTDDGVAIAGSHLIHGHRSVLVLCHGFGDHHHSVPIVWLAEHLVPWHDIIAFDWRGYGASGGYASFGGDEMRDLRAVMDYAQAHYRHVGLIGDSMGGLIALAAQAEHGLAKRVATLGAPACYSLTGWPRPLLFAKLAPHPAARTICRPMLGFRLGAVAAPRPLDTIDAIREPLLLIHGDRDLTVPVANAYALHERAGPNAHLEVYHGSSHALKSIRRSQPQRLLDDLRAHFAPLAADATGDA
jgi:uncharacterized protein